MAKEPPLTILKKIFSWLGGCLSRNDEIAGIFSRNVCQSKVFEATLFCLIL
jgi:hypothetical protein